MYPVADLHKTSIIRSQGLYWAVFDAAFESMLREFSEHVWDRADHLAKERQDYPLMAYNELHQQLEHEGTALVFIPMVFGIYSLDFSIFLDSNIIDFNVFARDQYTRDSDKDITLNLPSGKLAVAELGSQFSIDQQVIAIPAGCYRICCLNNREEQDKHAFLEDDHPPDDGPDFKFFLERQKN
jgi:hypothetical protein